MQSYFNSEFFTSNRERLRALFTGTAPIVLSANGLLQRGGDSTFRFAQDANFWYLTGLDEPGLVLVMDRDKEYLIAPKHSDYQKAFDGVAPSEALTRRSGIETLYEHGEGWERLAARLKKVKHAATLTPPSPYLDTYGMYTNPARAALIKELRSYNSNLQLLDLSPHLVRLRMIKQPPELQAIQAAIDVTIASLKSAFKPAKVKKYGWEYELEAEIAYGFRRRGAAGHGFEPIVAGGQRACTLHNVANDGELSADELVVVDVGAEIEHYSADITRTIALSRPSPRQRAVHAAVEETQKYAFELLGPGVSLQEYHQQAEQFLGEKMRELGLIKTITIEEIRKYCPHSFSHFLGLNVHDAGDYARPLEPGMVLTVEPGIYISDEALGVRIEDDVLITEKGIKILSGALPRVLD